MSTKTAVGERFRFESRFVMSKPEALNLSVHSAGPGIETSEIIERAERFLVWANDGREVWAMRELAEARAS